MKPVHQTLHEYVETHFGNTTVFFAFELYKKLKSTLITYLTGLQAKICFCLMGTSAASSALPPVEYVYSGPVQQF